MRTTNLDLIIQKGSWVIQMIIAHKMLHFKKMRAKIKFALAVELSIFV